MACYCCVRGCKNNNHKKTTKHFFRFPKNDEKRRSLWKRFASKNVNETSVICEDHFDPKFFIQKDKKLKLTNDAIPMFIINEKGDIETFDYDAEVCEDESSQILIEEESIAIEVAFVNEQMKLDELKFRCRFCCETRDELIEISSFSTFNINIEELLKPIGFDIFENDFLPNNVCEECFNQVVSLDNFLVKIKSSNQWFSNEINSVKTLTPAVATPIEIIDPGRIEESHDEILQQQELANNNEDCSTSIPISYDSQDVVIEDTAIKPNQKTKLKRQISESAIIDTTCNKFALKTYNCDVCLQLFAGLKTFKSHICNVPEIKCSDCGDVFDNAFALKSHRNYFHNRNISKNFCPNCKTVITGKLALFKKHKRKCNQDRNVSIQCELCQKNFTTLHAYNVHKMFHDVKSKLDDDVLATKPKRKADVVCELCGKTYTTIGDCRRHIKLNHTEITEVFCCDICNKNYPTKSVLNDHYRNTHVINEVACTFCGKVFRNKTHLKKHMVYHDESKRIHKCFICPEKPGFVNKVGLLRHQARHASQNDKINFNCDICINFNFHTSFQLKNHMKHVHGRSEDQ